MRHTLSFLAILFAQSRIQLWDFNSGFQGWTLNSGHTHNSPSNGNRWVRGAPYSSVAIVPAANAVLQCICETSNPYTAPAAPNQPPSITGSPQSDFLYISYNPTSFGCGGNTTPFTYIGAITFGLSGDCLGAERYFSFSPPVSIPASVATPVHLRFYWTGQANPTLSGGIAYFRIGSGAWQQVGPVLRGQTTWQQADFILTGVSGGQTIQVGFEFFNDDGNHGSNIVTSFGVDEVEIYYETPAAPTLALASVSPSAVCAGSTLTVSYTAQNFPGGTVFTAQLFDVSGTIIASASGASPISLSVPNTTASGTYQVRIAANTTPPTYSDTATINVINMQSLSCSAIPSSVLPGTAVSLEVSGTGLPSGPFNVTLNPGDGTAPLIQNGVSNLPVSFTHTYTASGSYTATFTVTHAGSGCSGTCQATVQVGGDRLEALSVRDTLLCAGDSFYVQYSSVGISFAAGNTFTVEVRDGGGNVIVSCPIAQTATSGSLGCRVPSGTPAGIYSVRITSSAPSYTSNTLALRVISNPAADFTPNTNLRFCVGVPISFTNRSQNALQVRWDFGDGQSSTVPNPTYTYTRPGTYTVTLTAFASATCSSQVQRQVEILPTPQASFTTSPPTLTLPDQNTVTFTNTSTGAVSYQWDFGNGQTSTAQNPTATYNTEGEYLVVLTAISADGCQDTAQYLLRVVFSQGISAPNTFTPNGDGINDRYIVRYSGLQTIRLSIYDRWGNLILTQQLNTPVGTIEWDGTKNGQALPEGVYAAYIEGKTIDGQTIRRTLTITLLR